MSNGQAWVDGAAFGCTVTGHEIRLEGEVDLAARPALDEALRTILSTDGVGEVSLDLDAVTFADSSAVAWLLSSDSRIRAIGGRMTIVACSPVVRHLLRITGIDGRLALVDRGSMR